MSTEQKENGSTSGEDRRESPRVPMRFHVRRAGSTEDFESREGDLSLGGLAWRGAALEVGTQVEVRLPLPGAGEDLQVRGEVVHVGQGAEGPSSRVRFVELPVEAEMSIARYLDDLELAEAKPRGGA